MCDYSVPEHGGQLRELASQFNIPEESLLDFSASIDPFPPRDALIDSLCESIRARKVLTSYPVTDYSELKKAIASYAGGDANAVAIGNGVMPLLAAALRAFCTRRCLVLVPAFAEYKRVLTASGVDRHTLGLHSQNGFAVDTNQVLAQLRATGAQTLLLANPQSPSGRLMPATELVELHHAASGLGVTTIVDEAFIDYVPEESLSSAAGKCAKLVVLRSVTKFFAMPGLRVGYSVSLPETRRKMEAAMPLWPVDSIAAQAARIVLLDSVGIAATLDANVRERVWLMTQLRTLGLTVFPGAANFMLIKTMDHLNGLEIWRRLIVEHGIVVRSCANFEGLNQQYFRVAVRTHSENQRLITALGDLTRQR
jgi:threonine-phosphate decarboxylase